MDLATMLELIKIGAFVLGIIAVLGVLALIIGLLKAIRGLFKFGAIVCIGIVILSLVGVISGKQIMQSLHVDDKIDKVVDKVNDDGIKKKVNDYVQDMIDSGTISSEQIDKYIESISKDPNLTLTLPDGTVVGEYTEPATADGNGSTQNNGAGANNTVPNVNNGNTAPNDSTGANSNTTNGDSSANANTNSNTTESKTQEPKQTVNSGYGSTADKVMSAMSAGDLATTQNVMSKVDIGYLQSLMDTDMPAAKAYVKSVLSSSEIAAAINVYGKYAYLLD